MMQRLRLPQIRDYTDTYSCTARTIPWISCSPSYPSPTQAQSHAHIHAPSLIKDCASEAVTTFYQLWLINTCKWKGIIETKRTDVKRQFHSHCAACMTGSVWAQLTADSLFLSRQHVHLTWYSFEQNCLLNKCRPMEKKEVISELDFIISISALS